jgi:hypothetical protein
MAFQPGPRMRNGPGRILHRGRRLRWGYRWSARPRNAQLDCLSSTEGAYHNTEAGTVRFKLMETREASTPENRLWSSRVGGGCTNEPVGQVAV